MEKEKERVEELERTMQHDIVAQRCCLVLSNGTSHWASNISVSNVTSGLQVEADVLRKVSMVVADIPYGITKEPWDVQPTKVCFSNMF